MSHRTGTLKRLAPAYGFIETRGEIFRFAISEVILKSDEIFKIGNCVWFDINNAEQIRWVIDVAALFRRINVPKGLSMLDVRVKVYDYLNKQEFGPANQALIETTTENPNEINTLSVDVPQQNFSTANEPDSTSDFIFDVVKSGDIATLTKLLEVTKSPDARNERGDTPLMIAALRGQAEIVQILIQYGANPWLKNNNGVNTFEVNCLCPQVRRFIKKYKADAPPEVEEKVVTFSIDSIDGIVEAYNGPRYVARLSSWQQIVDGNGASDGSYGWGYDFREGGAFGSFPGFDDYGDESEP